ncbi:MAG: sporulation transcriptional regulator SpoIIID [Oscillospiraceae bacterium]|nr:sporulation transcriptional regulator SpoIIID [Oscillospiraceae bacterium]
MKTDIEQRAVELALYIVENGATVRAAAKQFGVSKSTVHKDDGVIIGTVKGNAKRH